MRALLIVIALQVTAHWSVADAADYSSVQRDCSEMRQDTHGFTCVPWPIQDVGATLLLRLREDNPASLGKRGNEAWKRIITSFMLLGGRNMIVRATMRDGRVLDRWCYGGKHKIAMACDDEWTKPDPDLNRPFERLARQGIDPPK